MKLRIVSISLIVLVGCAEPGESTKMGAITGGAVGAGLGALVGSASGDAGTGLLLGAAAGAGTGAFVGNAFDAQNNAMRAQDEALERQERLMAAQQREVNELRRLNSDLPESPRARLGSDRPAGASREILAARRDVARVQPIESDSVAVQRLPSLQQPAVAEREILNSSNRVGLESYPAEPSQSAAVVRPQNLGTPECSQAAGEIERMHESTETADRLFHVRRALRLCPDNADYHVELGRVYQSLNRTSDAEFEFQEALRLDSANSAAQAGLREIKGSR